MKRYWLLLSILISSAAIADTGILAFGAGTDHTAGDQYEVFYNSQIVEYIPYAGQVQYRSVAITTLQAGDTLGVRATRCDTTGVYCIYSASVVIVYDPNAYPGGGPGGGESIGQPTDARLLILAE